MVRKRSKSSQELNRNFAVGGSIYDFTLSSTGLIYSVWQKHMGSNSTVGARAQLQLSLNADVSECCQCIRWFIIPIRPTRGFIEKYGLVGQHWETFTVPQSDRINFRLNATLAHRALQSFRFVTTFKHNLQFDR